MNKILMLGLLLISTVLHAGCEDLEIKIINHSSHNCVFKNKIIFFGTLPTSSIPSIIPAREASPIFFASQDDTGAGVLLTYNCDNEIVQFYSYQDYSNFFSGAGIIGGTPQVTSTLSLEYTTQMGSCFAGRPGQIVWQIS